MKKFFKGWNGGKENANIRVKLWVITLNTKTIRQIFEIIQKLFIFFAFKNYWTANKNVLFQKDSQFKVNIMIMQNIKIQM